MKFVDLFDLGEDLLPVESQKLRGEMFELKFQEVSQNRMRLWKENHNSTTKTKFLLGVCPSWNFYDLYFLDCINDALKKRNSKEIFQVLDVDSLSDFNDIKIIFGDSEFKQPPILGIWEKGSLTKSLRYWEARNFLIDKFKFVWSPIPPYIN